MQSVPLLLALAAAFIAAAASPARFLPSPVVAAYTNWGECGPTVTRAAEDGVNVVFWFSINLHPGSPPTHCLNLTCIAGVAAGLRARGLRTTHMVTVGGWDAPHPVNGSGADFYRAWKAWNEGAVAAAGLPGGFDGVDWDLEGNDNATSAWNTLGAATLDIVGAFSALAKADDYLVTLVPAESYFDETTPRFDASLTWPYPEWQPDFKYHGHNPYAYLWSRYGGAFDAVTVQLYESFSHANYNVTVLGQRPADYLAAWAARLRDGWLVDFGSDPAARWPSQRVAVPPAKLLVGLANGWAGGEHPKSLLIMPEEVGAAWRAGAPFAGAAFWCIAEEGAVPSGQSAPLWMAQGLNGVFGTRPAGRRDA